MSDYLPADLITKILLRLPVVSLLRYRSVSKAWRALIDSPRFSKLQIDYSGATGKNAILFITKPHGDYVVAEYVNGLHRGIGSTPGAQCSEIDPLSIFALLGSCNGLLCFAYNWEKVLILNAATKKGYFMPFSLDTKPHSVGVYSTLDGRNKVIYNHGYGFGYVSASDDYKVVQIVQLFNTEDNSLQSQLISYGVRSNSFVELGFHYILIDSRQTGVFVGGAIHWTVVRHDQDPDSGSEMVIVGFDLGLNQFREVPQPNFIDRNSDSVSLKLGELGNCLCIFASYNDKFVDVLILKDYATIKESWSILFSVPYPELCYTSERIVPLGFSATGHEVLLQLDGERLVWYDLKDPNNVAAAEEITIHGLDGVMDAVVCYGSLVSPIDKPKQEVKKVDKQQQKPRQQGKKRDDFLSSGFKLKL